VCVCVCVPCVVCHVFYLRARKGLACAASVIAARFRALKVSTGALAPESVAVEISD
jgi:hypothetical protein